MNQGLTVGDTWARPDIHRSYQSTRILSRSTIFATVPRHWFTWLTFHTYIGTSVLHKIDQPHTGTCIIKWRLNIILVSGAQKNPIYYQKHCTAEKFGLAWFGPQAVKISSSLHRWCKRFGIVEIIKKVPYEEKIWLEFDSVWKPGERWWRDYWSGAWLGDFLPDRLLRTTPAPAPAPTEARRLRTS